MHAVGAQRAGELCIALDKRGNALGLRHLHERPHAGHLEAPTLGRCDEQGRRVGGAQQRRERARIGAGLDDEIQSCCGVARHPM